MDTIRSHKDLLVWKKSVELITDVYRLTEGFPSGERFGLSSQMQRASVSIAANIAEGHGRGTRADYAHFLDMANGSVAELETLLIISRNLLYSTLEQYSSVERRIFEIGRMLFVLRTKLKMRPLKPNP